MGLKQSKLDKTAKAEYIPTSPYGWNNIKLTDITRARRQQLKINKDDFTGFTWRGIDAFEVFGAFIINDKNSLKFYNGPTYSNEYTKPMFESAAGQLTGVTFQQQKIDFTIGIYWISEEDYRQLIYWLHPYVIDSLTFDFEQNYYYQVKLASVENGNRYIIGEELRPNNYASLNPTYTKVYMYYTEMKLSFEVQGPNCAYRKALYEIKSDGSLDEHTRWNTDLPTPFQLTFDIDLSSLIGDTGTCDVEFGVYYSDIKYQLGYISLENLTKASQDISIKYDSETGLCFWNHGESAYFLLNRLSTLSTGKRFVNAINIQSYTTEGAFDKAEYNITNLRFYITPTNVSIDNVQYIMRARTNLI